MLLLNSKRVVYSDFHEIQRTLTKKTKVIPIPDKTLKYKYTKLISVSLNFVDMLHEMALFFTWYNKYRPHEYLKGKTPNEEYNNSPVLSLSNGPPVKMIEYQKSSDIPEMKLELSFLEGRKHLPIIEFRKVA